MRTLKFIVDGLIIKPDPECDFSNIVPGTSGYLQAEFKCSSDWNGTSKVAGFYSVLGREYKPQTLNAANACIIPAEALKNAKFQIQLYGLKAPDFKLKTNKVTVCQDGGK